MFKGKPQEQHCRDAMLLVSKGIVKTQYPSCGFSQRFSTEPINTNNMTIDSWCVFNMGHALTTERSEGYMFRMSAF